MLKHLYIRNFALIDELDISFQSGFSVITGETGAGKSIILGAIGLLLGQRADSKLIKVGASRCIVEAKFDLSRYQINGFFDENDIDYDPEECIIRRELTDAGKSRAFINDTPVQLTMLKALGEQLIDIHSQHQNLLLQKEDFQMRVVDIIAHTQKELDEYKQAFMQYKKLSQTVKNLEQAIAESKKEEDFIRFQLNEIQQAKLVEGEQEELEQESETLSHSEEIKSSLYQADSLLNSDDDNAISKIKTAINDLQSIEQVYPTVHDIIERLNSCYIELKDITSDISSQKDDIDFNPTRLEAINDKLDTIYTLQKKYHVNTVKELLDIMKDLKTKIENIDNSDDVLNDLHNEVNKQYDFCIQKASTLTRLRKKAAKDIEKKLSELLIPLGIPNVQFRIQLDTEPLLTPNGTDHIQFLFSANKNFSLLPISQVASGGEIARVMLSLKALISGVVKLPTIIFDEIDTGVSGKVAQKMAMIMQEMGQHGRQVISITHLPQIAAMGLSHYKVYKDDTATGTQSHMIMLKQEERITEIAQMLSGDNITEAAINNAKELLANK